MKRSPNTKRNGKDFSKKEELDVWNKAQIIPNKDSKQIRKDACGATIHFNKYGNRQSSYGWEVDHIVPVSEKGGDELFNLQPLHWKNNASKSDNPNDLKQFCKITL